MPGFDADAWRKARVAWTLRVDGRDFTAREVSAEQVIATQMQLQGASGAETRRIVFRLLRIAFPKTMRMRWAPVLDPVHHIAALPPPAFDEVVRSFFAYVTGNPVTSQTVMGAASPSTSSSDLSREGEGPPAPPTP